MKVPFAISLAIMLAACSMVPDYERPGVEVPAAWSVADADVARTVSAAWWRNFGDPELDALMTAALAANLDIASALARIEQSQGALRASGASLLPNVSAAAPAGQPMAARRARAPVSASRRAMRSISGAATGRRQMRRVRRSTQPCMTAMPRC